MFGAAMDSPIFKLGEHTGTMPATIFDHDERRSVLVQDYHRFFYVCAKGDEPTCRIFRQIA